MRNSDHIWLAATFIVFAIKLLDYLIPYLYNRHKAIERLKDDNVVLAAMIKDRNV